MMKIGLEHVTIKIWKKTLIGLRFIKAYTGETAVAILDRLVQDELKKVSHDKDLSI